MFQGERLCHAVGVAFTICLERQKKRESGKFRINEVLLPFNNNTFLKWLLRTLVTSIFKVKFLRLKVNYS